MLHRPFQSSFRAIREQCPVKRWQLNALKLMYLIFPRGVNKTRLVDKLAWQLEESWKISVVPEIERSNSTHFSRHSNRIEIALKPPLNRSETATGTTPLVIGMKPGAIDQTETTRRLDRINQTHRTKSTREPLRSGQRNTRDPTDFPLTSHPTIPFINKDDRTHRIRRGGDIKQWPIINEMGTRISYDWGN